MENTFDKIVEELRNMPCIVVSGDAYLDVKKVIELIKKHQEQIQTTEIPY